MLWSAVIWIIAILYFVVCHPVILPGSNLFKTLLHGLSSVLLSSLTSHPALRHFIGYRQRIILKTLFLVYKYLTTGQPKYFAPYLCLYKSAVNTRCSNPEKNMFLEVPHYCSSIHKSKGHFNNSFSYDTSKLWNDLSHDTCSTPNLSCFKSRLKTYLFQKSFPH